MKEDPRTCDESTWLVWLASSLVASVRDIVTGASSAANLLVVALPPTGLFVRDRPAALLPWYICNTMIVILLDNEKESWLKI